MGRAGVLSLRAQQIRIMRRFDWEGHLAFRAREGFPGETREDARALGRSLLKDVVDSWSISSGGLKASFRDGLLQLESTIHDEVSGGGD